VTSHWVHVHGWLGVDGAVIKSKQTLQSDVVVLIIDREFEFYEFFSFLKFNEFYEFFFG